MVVVCKQQNALFIVSQRLRALRPNNERSKKGINFLHAGMSVPEVRPGFLVHLEMCRISQLRKGAAQVGRLWCMTSFFMAWISSIQATGGKGFYLALVQLPVAKSLFSRANA